MKPVRRGVIPAAGWGTRFLPVTKAIPKEMLPVVDRPMVQYAVEEAAQAGIQHLTIVTSRVKESLAAHFDRAPELERFLEAHRETPALKGVRRLATLADLAYVTQQEQLGLGHAVLTARNSVGNEPFAVLLPDDIVASDTPAIGQLLQVYHQYGGSVVAVEEIPPEASRSYGVVDVEPVAEGLYRVKGLVEKPKPEEAPSRLGVVGRYVFTPGIFEALAEVRPGALGEIQLTDGMHLLAQREPMYAWVLQGKRYDVGTPLGLLKASVELALQREDLAPALRQWLKGLAL
ncbi:MAG: UTP--glucose-1-phosphate uridylyltransferase GalU [Dehalococcoidia bacterium]|nr:UTP--glucose-1-phosphate uridylyltransferase GalU [Dehalococcoidia bacterium]